MVGQGQEGDFSGITIQEWIDALKERDLRNCCKDPVNHAYLADKNHVWIECSVCAYKGPRMNNPQTALVSWLAEMPITIREPQVELKK